jgi:mediator of RNA polymerase II transcription subunit 12
VDVTDDLQETNEEIEQLWNSHLFLDKSNLTRIFETTVSKMETSFEEIDSQDSVVLAARGLFKLRHFNTVIFDDLAMGWIIRMRYCTNRLSLFRAFTILISESCIRIDTIIHIALTTKPSEICFSNMDRSSSSSITKPSSFVEDFNFCARVLELVVCQNAFQASLTLKVAHYLQLWKCLY